MGEWEKRKESRRLHSGKVGLLGGGGDILDRVH